MTQLHIKQYKKRNKSKFNYDDVVAIEYLPPILVERGRSTTKSVKVCMEGGAELILETEPFDAAMVKAGLYG